MVYIMMRREKDGRVIESLTKLVKSHWSKSVENLIQVGKCLHKLRGLLDRQEYVAHLSKNFSMSEMQAHRLEKLYLNFSTKASVHVLSAKPSVLYALMSSAKPQQINILAKGGKIRISGKLKKLEELTIKDMSAFSKKKEIDPFDVDEKEVDLRKAWNAHRRLVTLVEEISNWVEDLNRFQEQGIEIKERTLVKMYIGETIICLNKLSKKI